MYLNSQYVVLYVQTHPCRKPVVPGVEIKSVKPLRFIWGLILHHLIHTSTDIEVCQKLNQTTNKSLELKYLSRLRMVTYIYKYWKENDYLNSRMNKYIRYLWILQK